VDDKKIARPLWIVAGTRPEVIKLAPVYFSAQARFGKSAVQWISTGQHMQLEREMLAQFAITPDHNLNVRQESGTLVDVAERTIRALTKLQQDIKPALVIVQGDTVSTFAGAFAAFHAAIPVAHVEAGLRTSDIHDPFPEEAYRRMTDAMTDIHFPPTRMAGDNLRTEGYPEDTIYCTGNTAIDAVKMVDSGALVPSAGEVVELPKQGRLLFVTMHRRESWGKPLEDLCATIRDIVEKYDDVHVVLPVHVNPIVRDTVFAMLKGVARVNLAPPLDFMACHSVIRKSYLIMTDSGGIAEEAPSYGVPVLVLRKVTERPEAAQAGLAILTGTDREKVFTAACNVLDDPQVHAQMRGEKSPYGDGQASARITLAIERYLAGDQPLLTADEQFT